MIAIAIIITTLLENITTYIQEIPQTTRNAAQAIKTMTRNISGNKLFQKIKKSYKKAALAVNLVMNTTDCTSRTNQPQTTNRNSVSVPIAKQFLTINEKWVLVKFMKALGTFCV